MYRAALEELEAKNPSIFRLRLRWFWVDQEKKIIGHVLRSNRCAGGAESFRKNGGVASAPEG